MVGAATNEDEERLSLHDCLSMGEVERGLVTTSFDNGQGILQIEPSMEEMHRLPTLLRLLSASRPLSQCPSLHTEKSTAISSTKTASAAEEASPTQQQHDELNNDVLIDQAVQSLEDRAAIYSPAEQVEVVACHLAPAVCRKISRLRPLQRNQQEGLLLTENTTTYQQQQQLLQALSVVALSSNTGVAASTTPAVNLFSTTKRRKGNEGGIVVPLQQQQDDDLRAQQSDDDDSDEGEQQQAAAEINRKRGRDITTTTVAAAAVVSSSTTTATTTEDSQEATVLRILTELVSLVVASLQAPQTVDEDGNVTMLDWSLKVQDDSLLAQARSSSSTGATAATSDPLGAAVVSLMHHATVLRHEHVASALCRATVPQTADLIARMGANSPAAVPSLARGCLWAYAFASQSKSKNHAIAVVTRQAVRALAQLSARECSRIRTLLQHEPAMIDVQLELAIRQDPLAATCLLIQELSLALQPCGSRLGKDASKSQESLTSTGSRASGSMIDDSSRGSWVKMRPLASHLVENVDLFVSTLELLIAECRLFQDEENRSWGRLSFALTACSWTLCRVPMEQQTLDERQGGSQKVRKAFRGLLMALDFVVDRLSASISKNDDDDMSISSATPETNSSSLLDRPYSLLVCALVSSLMAACRDTDDEEQGVEEARVCATTLNKILRVPGVSTKSSALKATIECALMCRDPATLCSTIQVILVPNRKGISSIFADNSTIRSMALKACSVAVKQSLFVCNEQINTEKVALLSDQSALIAYLKNEDVPLATRCDRADAALSLILFDQSISSLTFVKSPYILRTIVDAMQVLLRSSPTKIPLVMPITMEKLAEQYDLQRFGQATATFLLHLVYCLEFMECEPDSPFQIDPRMMPLQAVFTFCETVSVDLVDDVLSKRLLVLIRKHCPEIPFRARAIQLVKSSHHLVSAAQVADSPGRQKGLLKQALQKSLENGNSDSSGSSAEKAFLAASTMLSDADLFTTTVSVLTSKTRKSPLFFSYSMLYRDPLVLLSCPLAIFKRKGWRRIAMYMLSLLLETNDWVAHEFAPDADAHLEYLCSRNEILMRCLMSVLCGNDSVFQDSRYLCGMTAGLVRRIVAERRGTAAMFVKQATSETALDWLVENVPETIEDWKALSGLLSDRNTMTSAERLVAAEGVLRIAVVQGHRYENEALSMVYAALAHLIASFFLVIGPVGVPVNTVVAEGTGIDATKVARNTAFRLLRALIGVRGYRPKLRNECGLYLQKLAGLCKGENIVSGIPISAASRQKSLLKELLDAIQKAADAMGCGSVI